MKLKMEILCRTGLAAFVIAIFGSVQPSMAQTNMAAQSWAVLTNFSMPKPPMSWQTNPPTTDQLGKFDDEQAAQAGALADMARNFYTLFPDNTNVSRARVTELQALQLAVHFGATNRDDELISREQALIADTNAPEELRYEFRLDQLGREIKANTAAGADVKTEMEKAGRELIKEFPNGPEGYDILLTLAESSDLAKMQEYGYFMAQSGGPKALTNLGNGLLHRLDIIGKPLPIAFTAQDGREVDLTTLSNKVVLVDFWATWSQDCVRDIPELKELYGQYHTNGFEIVGINFDDDTNKAAGFIQSQGLAWPQYFGGRDNKFGHDYALNTLPAEWLVDRKGIVQDIHGTMDLDAKVAKLMGQ
jgi:thiol-disulfide isomerase/thioredoxin